MKLLRYALALVLLLPLAACSDKDSTGPDANTVVGVWAVTEVEGESLPLSETIDFGGITCTITVTDVDLTFTSGGVITLADTSTGACEGLPEQDTSESVSGTYSVSGDMLTTTFENDDGEDETRTDRFTISGNTLTVFDGTTTTVGLVAQRQ
jgi:hypothetical protein